MEDIGLIAPEINGQKQFKLEDSRQKRIYEKLDRLVSPGIAKYFFDSCKLRSAPLDFYASSHLVVHLFREIESGIMSVAVHAEKENVLQADLYHLVEISKKIIENKLEGIKLKEKHFTNPEDLKVALSQIAEGVELDEGKRFNNRWQIEVLGKSLNLPQEIIDIWIGLLKENFFASQSHRNNLEDPRTIEENSHSYEKVEVIFDAVLDALEKSYDDILTRIDVLLENGPSKENATKLKNKFPKNYVCHSYFFSKNTDYNWLPFLKNEGFFKDPTAIEENKEEKTMRFVAWSQSEYLVRMADKNPELIKDILLEMNDTDNPTVLCDMISVVINLPPDVSVKLIEKIKIWARNPYQNFSLLDEKLGDLVVYWARNGMKQQASELLEIIFQENLKSETAGSDWQFEQFIKKYYKELIEKLGLIVVKITIEALDKARNTKPYDDESFMDGSTIWFPSIKNVSLEERENIEGNLIAALKIGWDVIRGGDIDIKINFIEELLKKERALFYRIACHLMSIDFEGIENLASETLRNLDALDDIDEYPEYGELLESFFEKLSPEDKKMIMEHIKSGPADNQKHEELLTKEYGAEKAKQSIILRTKNWQKNVLSWIKDFLKEDELNEITEDPDGGQKYHNRSSIASFVGPTSPYTEEQIESMSLEKLIGNLQSWNPADETDRDEFGFGPSKEGLGRMLTGVVKKDSQNFSKNAARFKDLDLEYVEGVFRGLREALREKKDIVWEPVLDLAKWAVQKTPTLVAPKKEEQARIGVRMSIVGLISEALQGPDSQISIDNRENIWFILEELMKDFDPTPERDEKQTSRLDDYTTAINSVRGEALQCVVIYAFWIKENQAEKDFDFKKTPEVQRVLEEHLSPSDVSRAVRAAYGKLFPFIDTLDHNWAQANSEIVFSGELLPEEISSAAWRTFLLTHPSRKHTFAILKSRYEQALENLKHKGDAELEDFENALINHLMGLFWNDVIDLGDDLLVNLFAIPNDKIAKSAIDSLGRLGLYREKNNKEIIDETLIEKLTKFYQERVKYIEENSSNFDTKTLEDYGWWFVSGVLDKKISLEFLNKTLSITKGQIDPDHLVFEKLEELADNYPDFVSQCLDLMVQNTEEKWVIIGNKDRIKKIISKLFKSSNGSTVNTANGIIGRLTARGYTEFSELKKDKSDNTDSN